MFYRSRCQRTSRTISISKYLRRLSLTFAPLFHQPQQRGTQVKTRTDQPDERRDISCTLAGPGRGDCEHFVGLPAELNSTTTDEYGRPHGWCFYCWLAHQYQQREHQVTALDYSIRDIYFIATGERLEVNGYSVAASNARKAVVDLEARVHELVAGNKEGKSK